MIAPEEPLHMERRHIREGLERLAKQEALIDRLEMHDPGGLLPQAHELLGQMHQFQKTASDRLARLLAEESGLKPS